MGTESKIQENPWKIKAISRAEENKSLKHELKRQKERAEDWREKAAVAKKCVAEQSRELESFRLKVNGLEPNIIVSVACQAPQEVGLDKYKFLCSIIWLSICLYKTGLSFRGVCEVLQFIKTFTGLKFAVPSYGTVRIWVQKMGFYLLENGGKIAQKGIEKREKWCVIVDESYSLGKSQLLVILGVRLSRLKVGQSLCCKDVVVLAIKSQATWKGEQMADVLREVVKKVDGDIEYGVADRGNNIVNGFQLLGIPHVSDWSHFSANILEKCYVDNADFKTFNEKMGAFKKKRKQSHYTDYCPPNLSVKVRFMNYDPFLKWANIMLSNFKKLPLDIAPELQFLKDLQPFIGEMTDLFEMRHKIGQVLKTQGINPKTQAKVFDLLKILEKDMNTKYPNSLKVMAFILGIKQYFASTMPIYLETVAQKPEKSNVAPSFDKFDGLVASSEVIESIFGKLKHRAPKDPKRGFTAFTLIITLFCADFSLLDTFKALKSVSIDDLQKWKKNNLVIRPYTSFRNVFKSKSKKEKRGEVPKPPV